MRNSLTDLPLSEAERWDIFKCCGMAEHIPVTKEKIEGWAKALGLEIPMRYSYHQEGIPYYVVDTTLLIKYRRTETPQKGWLRDKETP